VRTGRQIHEIGTGAHVLADHGAATVLHLAGSNAEVVTCPSAASERAWERRDLSSGWWDSNPRPSAWQRAQEGNVCRLCFCLIHGEREGGPTAATATKLRSNILVLVGTRPEAIKMFPVVLALQRSTWFAPVLVTTGQHPDLVRPILDLAEIEPDVDLAVGQPKLTLNDLVSSVIQKLDAVCRDRFQATGETIATRDQVRESGFPAAMLVHGDTSSAAAAAQASFQPAHSRRPRRGRTAYGVDADAVSRGTEPTDDLADCRVPSRADHDEQAEPRSRGNRRRPDLHHR
jgi:hypothetical protein